MIEKSVNLTNEEGLHARPAHLLAKEAMKFKCELQMLKNDNTIKVYNPKSILSIMSMGAIKGDRITLIANGVDEVDAIDTLTSLIESGFDE